jgi:propanol-preferring alcohol dehydrogenase
MCDAAVTRIKDITRGQGIELGDMVDVTPTLTMAAQVSPPLGHLTIVGHGNASLPVTFSSPAA